MSAASTNVSRNVVASASSVTSRRVLQGLAPPIRLAINPKSVKHGVGRLTATAHHAATRLTQVSHKAPSRLVPIGKSSVDAAGAAVCALSNYGAGMLPGDSSELFIDVKKGAKLGVVTQGANRIYTPNQNMTLSTTTDCHATLTANVEEDAMLVLAPDPCALFARSSFTQRQSFYIHPKSSVALIDWFSSGRYMNREQWQFDKLHTQTSLYWMKDDDNNEESLSVDDVPFLQDSTMMDFTVGRQHLDTHGVSGFNCFASLLLYGDKTASIVKRCQRLSDGYASGYTRTRQREDSESTAGDTIPDYTKLPRADELGVTGRIVMGVSRVELPTNPLIEPRGAHVVRLAARTNEDLYRVLHEALLPISSNFGLSFYQERIRARTSEIPKLKQEKFSDRKNSSQNNGRHDVNERNRSDIHDQSDKLSTQSLTGGTENAFWSIVMLADSGLPTGSFAHSAGLEAAAQLRLIRTEQDVENFAHAATRSTMQVSTPFLMGACKLVQEQQHDQDGTTFTTKWERLNRQCSAVMAANEPAYAASVDQAKSLARIVIQWLRNPASNSVSKISPECIDEILECLTDSRIHIAPTIGVLGAVLGLDQEQVCKLFAYCVARDMVSAAVRLSLVGPLASVPLLHRLQESADDGTQIVVSLMDENQSNNPLLVASNSAPVIEALHPCHEILQTRLFRS